MIINRLDETAVVFNDKWNSDGAWGIILWIDLPMHIASRGHRGCNQLHMLNWDAQTYTKE